MIDADLHVPARARGVVVFAHGSGSGRKSPRNRSVAAALQDGGLATLMLDLLTPAEDEIDQLTRKFRFDIEFLASRLVDAVRWLGRDEATGSLGVGLFGSSTGAAAALVAAAELSDTVGAVVSRGGRPDLAGHHLALVEAPTLLIVGSLDEPVIGLNRDAFTRITSEKDLVIVPGASHLFEEPGTLEIVASLARSWFGAHLSRVRSQARSI